MCSTQDETHKLNEYGFIDYKRPLNKQSDMRTSMYMGNKHMTDSMLGNKIHAKFKETKPFVENAALAKQQISDYKNNFVWKFGDPNDLRNPTLARIDFIKPFYESNMKFLKRPMVPAYSVSHADYLWRPEPPMEPPELPHMPTPIATTKITIDPAKPGYSKYLDPAATTTRLDYCHRTPQDIMSGIAAKDNITFWNWQNTEYRTKKVFYEKDPQQCDKVPSTNCVKRRCEFPSLVKPVPHTGLTTEVRENYVEPHKNSIEYDSSHIRLDLPHVTFDAFAKKSEYDIVGSGEQTQKYV